jgi:hypothetical protein
MSYGRRGRKGTCYADAITEYWYNGGDPASFTWGFYDLELPVERLKQPTEDSSMADSRIDDSSSSFSLHGRPPKPYLGPKLTILPYRGPKKGEETHRFGGGAAKQYDKSVDEDMEVGND